MVEVVDLEAEPYEGSPPTWAKSNALLARDWSHQLTRVGDTFIVVSSEDIPGGSRLARTSNDGLTWSDPVEMMGIPPGSMLGDVLGGGAGAMLHVWFPAEPGQRERDAILTSADGITWSLESSDTLSSYVDPLPVSDAGFAVVSGVSGVDAQMMWQRPKEGKWEAVDLPTGLIWEGLSVGDNHAVTGRIDQDREDLWVLVEPDGRWSYFSAPVETGLVTSWQDSMLVWNLATPSVTSVDTQPILLLGYPGSAEWHRLPTPAVSLDEEQFWVFEVIAAGDRGVIGVGERAEDEDPWFPDDAIGIVLAADGRQIVVTGDCVTIVDRQECWEEGVETETWFDEHGTLTVPDPDTHETVATFTCTDMRQAVSRGELADMGTPIPDLHLPRTLLPWPKDQEVWHSPDGQAWHRQRAQELFGEETWVSQGVTIGTTTVLLAVPNGRRPLADPPGCELGLYPAEEPIELWVTTEQ